MFFFTDMFYGLQAYVAFTDPDFGSYIFSQNNWQIQVSRPQFYEGNSFARLSGWL